ncbi:efflux RND transporter periplasmic adaptor subunit [Dyadobacter psychrophilus]|uniref:Membrane fusion protein, cobalt-zinc-cadmium efflux system n=1 Tax=Dyadobacter psychrophilus TaxID=651661 RepID=A0A1T5B765_9BACT|nr:efflux RND transporter periplasmic adaptor subunit [Dyadobacter psychrophilus]SKB43076.1 membrane fusion protein, cobalt-zinc-cadmium efflux system [Dyadobacter psychrophilus]
MKYLIYSVLLGLFVSCSKKAEKEPETTADATATNVASLSEKQIQNAGIVTALPEKKQISSVLKLNGKIDVPPQNIVSISVPLGGYLKTTKLLPGTRVKRGEVLAVMEDQQYIHLQQDYLTGQARVAYLENDYLRQKDLNKNKSSSDKIFQQAESDYQGQQVMMKSLYEKLKLAGIIPEKLTKDNISRSVSIHSPINGYVSKVNVNIGRYVSPTDVLFELINPTDIHLALKVFEKDLDKIKIGQQIMAYTNNAPDKKYPCEIILVSKDLSPERTAEVHSHFEKYEPGLLPGMFMNGDIQLDSRFVLVLPDDAIVSYEDKQFIFTAKGKNSFEMKQVKSGTSENGFTEIVGEQLENQLCVVKGAYSLLMSLKNKSEE